MTGNFEATYRYRAAIKRIKAQWHADISRIWAAYGQPSASDACAADFDAAWRLFKGRVAAADIQLGFDRGC